MLPAKTFQALIAQLRTSISLSLKVQKSQTTAHYSVNGYENERFYTDRQYHGQKRPQTSSLSVNNKEQPKTNSGKKACFVCSKEGCWSTRHSPGERIKSMADFKIKTLRLTGRKYTGPEIRQFLSDFEGLEPAQEIPDNFLHFHVTQNDEESDDLEDFFRTGNFFSDSQTETTSDFEGILIETGATKVSTAGYNQYLALKRLRPTLKIDNSRAGEAHIIFGIGSTSSLGTTDVDTPVGTNTFHITNSVTPFLFYLLTQNSITGEENTNPVIRKYGHPFLLLEGPEESLVHSYEKLNGIIECHLTDTELRQLHRRFGHPSADRLAKILSRSGHDFNRQAIKHLTKFCDSCQKYSKSPGIFKFNLKDDKDFNSCVYIDVLYIDEKSVLQNSLRNCWIDVYLGPPDVIVHDAGTNFTGKEFKKSTIAMSITTKVAPTEAHHSIGLVERYHTPLRRAYEVISKDLGGTKIDRTSLLQMAVKAVNDTAGPDGLVPTLLVFSAYPRMIESDPLTPSIFERAAAIKSAMKEVRKIRAKEQVRNALKMRKGPITSELKRCFLEWTSSCEDCVVQVGDHMPNFRSTSVKPYYSDKNAPNSNDPPLDEEPIENNLLSNENSEIIEPRRSNRIRKPRNFVNFFVSICNLVTISSFNASSFLLSKEVADREISIRLRAEAKITTPGKPFEASRKKEFDDLITKRIFEFIPKASVIHGGERIFSARMVDTIKYNDSIPYEKSRLVVQAYNDLDKEGILTQSPTIQRSRYNLTLRDITQAPPRDISHLFPVDKLLLMLKPLYGIPESGNHWWNTYHKYHLQRLLMRSSTFDPCLLISTTKEAFRIFGMQVDDALGLKSPEFAKRENEEIRKAKFMAKPLETLSPNKSISFNGTKIEMKSKNIYCLSKGQTESIRLVNENSVTAKDEYRSQRTRGAYVACICQPESSYGLSTAAQHQNPNIEDIKKLNSCLQWKLSNQSRGIRYIPVLLESTKLLIFVGASFADNKDFSPQIGFVIIHANESNHKPREFLISGNLIHWTSVNCRKVTRAVLASELYAMVLGVDLAIALSTTLDLITELLGTPHIPSIIFTDSFSLYECLVKLGSTKEKRLMIDIMAIRESYERREISEIRWINGLDNPTDAMTKVNPTNALRQIVDSNELRVRVEGWVERTDFCQTKDNKKKKKEKRLRVLFHRVAIPLIRYSRQDSWSAKQWGYALIDRLLTILWGIPSSIISDHDRKFTSEIWRSMFDRLGVKLHFTTAWHPQSDGLSERTNQTVEIAFRYFIACLDETRNWEEVLPIISATLSNSTSRSTGLAATEVMYGNRIREPVDVTADSLIELEPIFSEIQEPIRTTATTPAQNNIDYTSNYPTTPSLACPISEDLRISMRQMQLSGQQYL
ncbi:hypothetical protein EPUL_004120, partial [Erysiphe pulchra]